MTVHVLHRGDTAAATQQVFIGALLAGSPSAVVELGTLTLGDFTDVCARTVFEVLQQRVERAQPLEPVLVLRDLLAGGHTARWPEGVGPGPWLYDALSQSCTDASVPSYAAELRADSARRVMWEVGTRLAQAARAESLDSLGKLAVDQFAALVQALNRAGAG